MVTKKSDKPAAPRAPSKRKPKRELTIFEKIVKLGESIPDEELANHPPDFASNYHHYMHGHPKQESRW